MTARHRAAHTPLLRRILPQNRPAVAGPSTAIDGSLPPSAGPAASSMSADGRAAADPRSAAAPIDRVLLDLALEQFRAEVAQGLISHSPHTARSHVNAGS